MLNLDTHIFIRAVEQRLTRREERVLADDRWMISAIVLWEIENLHRSGRTGTGLTDEAVLETLSQVQIVPIDVQIARSISKLDFHSDPADELIAATSVQLAVPLVTRDERILKSRVVPLIRF